MSKEKTNLFISNLTKSNEKIKETRIKRIAQQVEILQEDLIRSIKSQVLALESKLEDLEDLNPDTTNSLNPVKGDFNAKKWVDEVQDTSISLANKKMELLIAENTYNKHFK